MTVAADACDQAGARELVERDGFVVHESIVPLLVVEARCEAMDRVETDEGVRRRRGRTFALRNVLSLLPQARAMAHSSAVRELAAPHLPGEPRVTRAILFDKNPEANWKVPWHQDVTIAVRERVEAPGFGPWSVKAGVAHVQPPAAVLARMITLRIALDDCDAANGPLLVLPGTHGGGILDDESIERARANITPVECTTLAGGIVVMRPLLLHASSAATNPRRRRILHLEFAGESLPNGLEWAA